MAVEQGGCFVGGGRNGRGHVKAHVEQHLLQDGRVQPRGCDAHRVKGGTLAEHGGGKGDALPGRRPSANHQGQSTTFAFEADDDLPEATEPSGPVLVVLRSEGAPTKGHDGGGGHQGWLHAASLHLIPLPKP